MEGNLSQKLKMEKTCERIAGAFLVVYYLVILPSLIFGYFAKDAGGAWGKRDWIAFWLAMVNAGFVWWLIYKVFWS